MNEYVFFFPSVFPEIIVFQCLFLAKSLHSAKIQSTKFHSSLASSSPTSLLSSASALPQIKPENVNFKIGIIGCGNIGKEIVKALLMNGFKPSQVLISTRRPASLEKITNLGVQCFCDNAWAAQSGPDLLILCCLPAQFHQVVGSELRGKIPARTLLCSTLLGVPEKKLESALQCRNCIATVVNVNQIRSLEVLKNVGPESIPREALVRLASPLCEDGSVKFLENWFRTLTKVFAIDPDHGTEKCIRLILEHAFGSSDFSIAQPFTRSLAKKARLGEEISLEFISKYVAGLAF